MSIKFIFCHFDYTSIKHQKKRTKKYHVWLCHIKNKINTRAIKSIARER